MDFARPAAFFCLGDAFSQVLSDRVESSELGGVDAEDGTADAGVFVLAGGAVGAGAGAELDPAECEVLLELVPLFGAGFAVGSAARTGDSG